MNIFVTTWKTNYQVFKKLLKIYAKRYKIPKYINVLILHSKKNLTRNIECHIYCYVNIYRIIYPLSALCLAIFVLLKFLYNAHDI